MMAPNVGGKATIRDCGLRGQGSIEFMLVLPLFLAIVFAILFTGFAYMQRADIDYQLSRLAGDLPADWQTKTDTQLVTELMCSESQLDPDMLTVTFADIERTHDVRVDGNDGIAHALGAGVARRELDRVVVTADVEYKVDDAFTFGREVVYKRHVERSYVASTGFEVS